MNPNENEYIDISDVAQMLCISKQSVYMLVYRKKIPFYKPVKKLLFKRCEIQRFIDKTREQTEKEIAWKVHNDNIKFGD